MSYRRQRFFSSIPWSVSLNSISVLLRSVYAINIYSLRHNDLLDSIWVDISVYHPLVYINWLIYIQIFKETFINMGRKKVYCILWDAQIHNFLVYKIYLAIDGWRTHDVHIVILLHVENKVIDVKTYVSRAQQKHHT